MLKGEHPGEGERERPVPFWWEHSGLPVTAVPLWTQSYYAEDVIETLKQHVLASLRAAQPVFRQKHVELKYQVELHTGIVWEVLLKGSFAFFLEVYKLQMQTSLVL